MAAGARDAFRRKIAVSSPTPVVALGIDATQISLIDRLVEAGRMPTLAGLRARGKYGRLQSSPSQFLSMVWPTFFSGQRLGHHGQYFNKIWRCEHQRLEYISPSWLPARVFWEGLEPTKRLAVLDVPYSNRPRGDFNGLYLNGWQCHDDFGPMELPAGLRAELTGRHGPSLLTAEVFGPQSARDLLMLRQEVLATNDQFSRICTDVLKRERWDLFFAVFGGAHRGTHYLWDLSQIDESGVDAQTLATLRGARDDIYTSWDAALGNILPAIPSGARLLIFSLHGMESNDGWYETLARIIEQVHRGGGEAPPPKKGLVYRLKKALPWRLVRQVTRRIPHSWNHALVPLWSGRMYDWAATRYFSVPMDYNGYIRLNVRGRERDGIVEPGDVKAVSREIREALMSFRDIESGAPVISDVVEVDALVGADSPRRRVLPDLVVLWAHPHPLRESSGVVSDKYGTVRWPKGAKLSSGRSGNHTSDGWFVATGPGLEPGPSPTVHDSLDLMPTIFEWMGAKPADFFQGRPIAELTGRSAGR